MNHIDSIEAGLRDKTPYNEIVRKVYLSYPTRALMGDEEREYQILNEISCFFKVPIMTIQVAGSAKTGRSFHKRRNFEPGNSDLDIAIIDAGLFLSYAESVFTVTKGYSDNTKFAAREGRTVIEEYLSYLTKGIFRPDLMPTCEQRKLWNQFFGQLSRKHGDLFKSINACIYMSQVFFESKQRSAIRNYLETRAV